MKKYLLPLVALSLLGASCQKQTAINTTPSSEMNTNATTTTNQSTTVTDVRWDNTADGWMAFGTPPECPEPFTVTSPVNIADATAILYPGQSRPDYKPHGGFRFDNAPDNNVPYVSPITGTLIRGSQYLTGGQIQYTFDIVHPCGMMVRVGHLLALTPKFKAIADTFPAATEGDSRTTRVNPPVEVTAGEQIATQVGLSIPSKNVFADFGLFDLRQKNAKSQDPAWAAVHSPELDQHALCWFNYLSDSDALRVRSLPAGDPKAGKTSDFCN